MEFGRLLKFLGPFSQYFPIRGQYYQNHVVASFWNCDTEYETVACLNNAPNLYWTFFPLENIPPSKQPNLKDLWFLILKKGSLLVLSRNVKEEN